MTKDIVSKILICMGFVILAASLVDYSVLVFPANLNSAVWINSVAIQISERSIMPIIAIVSVFGGLLLLKTKPENNLINPAVKILGVFSLFFSMGLLITAIMYGITMNKVEDQAISGIKKQSQEYQAKISSFYEFNKSKISSDDYNKYLDKLDQSLISKINAINTSYLQINIKTILNLLFFAILYAFTGVLSILPQKCHSEDDNGIKA
jgi:hypothetical protein